MGALLFFLSLVMVVGVPVIRATKRISKKHGKQSKSLDGKKHHEPEKSGKSSYETYRKSIAWCVSQLKKSGSEANDISIEKCASETASGNCGESIEWCLDQSGTLTISGTGSMSKEEEGAKIAADVPTSGWVILHPSAILDDAGDYTSSEFVSGCFGASSVPWAPCRKSIRNVVIKEGVTSINNFAFLGCINLKSVSIPSSVFRIGQGAFELCTSLEAIVLPRNIQEIGSGAFCCCTSLSYAAIPDRVTEIGTGLFCGCSALKIVVLSYHIKEIGPMAFRGCDRLEEIALYSYPDFPTKDLLDKWISNLLVYGDGNEIMHHVTTRIYFILDVIELFMIQSSTPPSDTESA